MSGQNKNRKFISMSTLIIHPDDRSTDFLRPIYAKVPNATIVTGGIDKSDVAQLIAEHEQVMMMGHGSPFGLFAVGDWRGTYGYIIDYTMVPMLRQKTNNVFIWCNADKFVNTYNLKGFYSGMFISEVGEAYYCGLPNTKQETVTASNNYFAELVGEVIAEKPLAETYTYVKENYGLLAESNPVALYNFNRLYLN